MKSIKKREYVIVFLLDLLVLNFAFFSAVYIKRGYIIINREYFYLLLSFYLVLLISVIASKKYRFTKPINLREGLNSFFRSFLYMALLLFFIFFIFKLFFYSRFIILAALIFYIFIETIGYIAFYLYKWGPDARVVNNDDDMDLEITKETQEYDTQIDFREREVKESLKSKLNGTYALKPSVLNNFLDSAVNLDYINASDSMLFDANSSANVEGILNERMEFIGNIRNINDINRVNKFFIAVNQRLALGGYFFGVVETIEQRWKRKFSKYPKLLRKFLYVIDFIWTRIFPKFPVLKKIYFMIHGKDRKVLSKWELLGRLHFCGFRNVKMEEVDKKLYIIVKKVRVPLEDKNPSYGPVFKQKRIGMNGEDLYIYKFRTMYPYSEYIHKYVLEKYKLNSIGKIKKDVRVTLWGRIMRKLWLDELPMLINLIQGDIKFVGLRPLSKSFFEIYPEDLKRDRIKVKPGLLPAIYSDMPESIEEVWESESNYLNKHERHPWRTDFIYFFRIMNNIIFHKARSG